jgi:hypothetical protein
MLFCHKGGRSFVIDSGIQHTENFQKVKKYHSFCSRGGSVVAWFLNLISRLIVKVAHFGLITKYNLSNCSNSKPNKKNPPQNVFCLLWIGKTCYRQLASHVLFYSMTKTWRSIFSWYGNESTSSTSNQGIFLYYKSEHFTRRSKKASLLALFLARPTSASQAATSFD